MNNRREPRDIHFRWKVIFPLWDARQRAASIEREAAKAGSQGDIATGAGGRNRGLVGDKVSFSIETQWVWPSNTFAGTETETCTF